MKIAVVQMGPEFGNVEGNLARVVSTVASGGADLFVFPELVLSGYQFTSREEALSFSQEPSGRVFDKLADAVKARRAAAVVGFAEKAGDVVYNSSLLLAPDGGRAIYRKIQLFWGEKEIFEPGDRPPSVVEAGGVRLGMMGLGIDYRQSYIEGPVSWGQLMGDFWIFFPIPIVKPFIKIGVGFIHLKVKDVEIPGTDSHRDGDLIKGLGFRGGAGLLVKPIKWISVGATCEVAGTYFREENDTTWGYAVDVTAHFAVHI